MSESKASILIAVGFAILSEVCKTPINGLVALGGAFLFLVLAFIEQMEERKKP